MIGQNGGMIPPVAKVSGLVMLLIIRPAGVAQIFCLQAAHAAHNLAKKPWGAAVPEVAPATPGAPRTPGAAAPGAPAGIPPGTWPTAIPAARRIALVAAPVWYIHFMFN